MNNTSKRADVLILFLILLDEGIGKTHSKMSKMICWLAFSSPWFGY